MTLVLDPVVDPLEEIPTLDPVTERLIKARALIANPEDWGKGALRTLKGRPGQRTPNDSRWRYCMIGAIAYADLGFPETTDKRIYDEAVLRIGKAIGKEDIAAFNDHWIRIHADVLVAFDKAIAMEQIQA